MFREPVAGAIIQGTLEAIAACQSRWKTPEAVWKGFREWSARRSRTVAVSFGEKSLFYHELQCLYEFGEEAGGGREFLALSGRRFADIMLQEGLSDLLAAGLRPGSDLPSAIEGLFLRFMDEYARLVYRMSVKRGRDTVSFSLDFADPEATAQYLAAYGQDARLSFRRSFEVIVAIADACLEYLLDPWKPENLSADLVHGTMTIRFPKGTSFHYRKLVETLTRFAGDLQKRHREALFSRDLEHDLLLRSPSMREKWEMIRRASATDEIILLRGEPGTGKTYLAERIHEMSARKGRPFVEVGLTADVGGESLIHSHLFGHVKGAFTSAVEDKRGLFALADTGTIFLDEMGDAGPELQARLLRVMEKRTFKPLGGVKDITVDVRILAATNRDLESMVRQGRFREDLYHRINVIQIQLPALRERSAEIPVLCDHFLKKLSAESGRPSKELSPEALDTLSTYPWPGNIRELIHVLKYALVFSLGEKIGPRDLPDSLRRPAGRPAPAPAPARARQDEEVIDAEALGRLLAESDARPVARNDTANCAWHIDYAKKTYLKAVIRHCGGNLRRIASYWDCSSERTVRALVKKLGLWDELVRARASP
jgi:DNA-binding NtrC family response regulator